jgi:hypothetical protein
MITTRFVIDFRKIKEIGGGSTTTFCKRHNLPRVHIYAINNRQSFNDGSKSQMIAEKLMSIGVGKWIEIDEEKAIA